MKLLVGTYSAIWCLYEQDIFDISKEIANRMFFVRCGYGLDLYGRAGFRLRCALNRTVRSMSNSSSRQQWY